MTTKIEAIKADITKVNKVEAIVNAANSSLKGGGGVDGAIHKAAGPELMKECRALGGCSTGDAKITRAYQLPYKAIIHTVGPMWKGGKNGEALLLENCYVHTLELAEKSGIRSLAFPSISTGVYRYPLKEAAEIAVKTVTKYCEDHPDAFDYICWALLVEPTRRVYETEILSHPLKNKEAVVLGPDGDALSVQYTLQVSNQLLLPKLESAELSETPLTSVEFDDIVDIEFTESVSQADRIDYTLAAASGLISGALSIVWSKALDLEAAHNWGTEKLGKVVVDVAKTQGFKKGDLEGAIVFLEKKFPMAGDAVTAEMGGGMGGGLQHHLRDFTHHPTIIGLIFSILSQFTGKGFGTDTQGVFQAIPLPEHAVIGKNFEEKILFGTINWAFHLISDMNGTGFNPGKGTGIPGPMLSLLKGKRLNFGRLAL